MELYNGVTYFWPTLKIDIAKCQFSSQKSWDPLRPLVAWGTRCLLHPHRAQQSSTGISERGKRASQKQTSAHLGAAKESLGHGICCRAWSSQEDFGGEAMKVAEEPAQRFPPSRRTSLQTWGLILGWRGSEKKCWPPAQVPSGLGSAAALDLAWKSYLRSQVFVAIQPDWVTDGCTGNLVFRHCPLRSEQGFPVIPKPQSFFIVLTLINPKNSGNISHSGSKWQACMASPRWWNAVILDNSLLAPPATPGRTCHSRSKSLLLIIRRSTYMAFFIQRSPTSVYKLQFSLKTQ